MTVTGPLPIVDAARILQEQSLRALRAALPPNEYIFRDERVDDYGVDGSLELLVDGNATNIRAQIQLKGRSKTQPNADGGFSVQIETSNLNYLLNGLCPLYVLYRPEANELRFALARDEWLRLESANPAWRDQASVSIHFKRVLTGDALAELRRRVAEEAKLHRAIEERLNGLRDGAGRVVIDAKTLAVTDSQKAVEMLSRTGQELSNSGFSGSVIELGRTIPTSLLLGEPRAALAVAYAHFHLAHYYDASAALRQLILSDPQLDAWNRSLLDVLFISVKRMLGETDQPRYEGEMAAWSQSAPDELAVQYEITQAWSKHLEAVAGTGSEDERSNAEATLRKAFERGRSVGGAYSRYNIELLELTLEQYEVEDGMLNALAQRDITEHGVGDAHYARVVARESRERAAQWFEKLTNLAERTSKTVPHIHCEVRLLHDHAVLSRAGRMHLMAKTGHGQALPQQEIEDIVAAIKETLQLARSLENLELEVTAMQNLARAKDIFGQQEEATVLATEALKRAELIGSAIHVRQLGEFLRGEDRHEARLRQLEAVASSSEESIIGNADDRQLLFMATTIAEASHLPQARIANILRVLQCRRRVALERRDWCKHLVLAEYQQDNVIRMYAQAPMLKVLCSRFEHESLVRHDDVLSLTKDLRDRFCSLCHHREPELVTARAPNTVRNRAKAIRRTRRGK